MIDVEQERGLTNPLLISKLPMLDESMKSKLENLKDKALIDLNSLITKADNDDWCALRTLERLIGPLTDDEFKHLSKQVHDAYDNRFGPVPGLF